eukprot:GHVQ01012202.1.p4 GENE.GHVQ01012202.1~~GHVQ01012202.1.p4  ORF type:complete len:162 (+),score=25.13 GHVQ01012202.1:385-870(+)
MEKGGNEEEPREQPEQRGRQPPTTEGKGSVVDLDFTTANPLAAIDIDELNPEPIGPLRSADDQSDSIPRPVISETSQPTMVTALSKLCKPWRSAQDNRESQTVKKKGGKEIPSLLHWEGIVPVGASDGPHPFFGSEFPNTRPAGQKRAPAPRLQEDLFLLW